MTPVRSTTLAARSRPTADRDMDRSALSKSGIEPNFGSGSELAREAKLDPDKRCRGGEESASDAGGEGERSAACSASEGHLSRVSFQPVDPLFNKPSGVNPPRYLLAALINSQISLQPEPVAKLSAISCSSSFSSRVRSVQTIRVSC